VATIRGSAAQAIQVAAQAAKRSLPTLRWSLLLEHFSDSLKHARRKTVDHF
jgi:hypothetical protein